MNSGSEIYSRQYLVIHVLTGETGNLNALGGCVDNINEFFM